MSDFRPLTEPELAELQPEQLIAYHHEARRLGRHDEARTALAILVWGFLDRVRFWVGGKLPRQEVDDVAGDVIASAIRSSFEGTEPGQFGAWLKQIAHRRVADYFEAQARRPPEAPLPEEHEGDEDVWGPAVAIPDPTQEVVERSVVKQALGELNEVHCRIVEIAGAQDLGFEQRPARETAQLVNDQLSAHMSDPMTEANVHQILSRFRRRVRELLDDDGGGSRDG
ncbi:MAG: RNA polymerase sigma factor [Thermoleophilaceae bacterium]